MSDPLASARRARDLAAEIEAAENGNGHGDAENIEFGEPDNFYIDWHAFCAADHDEAEWDFPDVLARGRGHALYAPAGHGKSLFSLWLSVEMTRLHPDLHVHYFDYEMTEADLHERLDNMGVLDPVVLDRLHYALLPDLPPLDTPQGAVAMMERIDAVRVTFPAARHATVIDTMGRAVAGEENDADTYRDFSRLTGMQLRRRCITWVRCDHAGKDPAKMQRGSSAKNDNVDVVWLLVPTDSGATLKRDKARMGWVPERVTFAKLDEPLRYERRTDDWPEGTGELANLLDRLKVAPDATAKVVATRLREFGEPRRKQLILAAQRFRGVKIAEAGTAPRNRREPSDDGSGNQDDFDFSETRLGTVSGTVRNRVLRQAGPGVPLCKRGDPASRNRNQKRLLATRVESRPRGATLPWSGTGGEAEGPAARQLVLTEPARTGQRPRRRGDGAEAAQ